MNSQERIKTYLKGGSVDRRPNLTIVGSVVTQYTGIDIETYCKDAKAMVQAAILAAEDLKLDYIQIASDLVREAEAFGSGINYSPIKLPTAKQFALNEARDVQKLQPLKTAQTKRLADLVEATAYARSLCPTVPTMTLVVGPATVAGNTRGVNLFLTDFFDDEEAAVALLDIATETALDLIRSLADVGAAYLYVADPVASLFSPRQYAKYMLPRHQRIFAEMKHFGITPRLHMCGNTLGILPFSSQSGAEIIDIDYAVDYVKALEAVSGRCLLNGNIDPVTEVFHSTPAAIFDRLVSLADSVSHARGLFMPGCELPTKTPLENVRAIAKAIESIGN